MTSTKINPEVSEIIGAFTGDGWIETNKSAFYITGSPTEDRLYYDNYISRIFSKQFIHVHPREFSYWGVYGICTYKKEVIEQLKALGCKSGKKSNNATIPLIILESKDNRILQAFIRGLFDTDGSFWCERSRTKTSSEWKRTHNHHPEIRITSCSLKLLEQTKTILDLLKIESEISLKNKKGFANRRNNNNSYALNVRKISEIEKWFSVIGTNNPRHITRYEVWKKTGHLPPGTTITERTKLLESFK